MVSISVWNDQQLTRHCQDSVSKLDMSIGHCPVMGQLQALTLKCPSRTRFVLLLDSIPNIGHSVLDSVSKVEFTANVKVSQKWKNRAIWH